MGVPHGYRQHVDGRHHHDRTAWPPPPDEVPVRQVRFLLVRVTEKGQLTIPKHLRDELGIGAGTEVDVERRGDTLVIRKAATQPTRGQQLVNRLRGRGDVAMTTDEIMALTRGD